MVELRQRSFFSAVSTSLSFLHTPNANLSLVNGYDHSHLDGWLLDEIYCFADSVVNDGRPFIRVDRQPTASEPSLTLSIPDDITATEATLYYSMHGDVYSADGNLCLAEWKRSLATIEERKVHFNVPEQALIYYIAIRDSRGLIIASQIVER